MAALLNKEYTKRRDLKLRTMVLNALGNQCKLCGFSDQRALQIDHVHGHGKQELQQHSRYVYYHLVLAGITLAPGRYQLLCANCNWIKRHGTSRA